MLYDFDESDLLFLHSLYCLVVRRRVFVHLSVLSVGTHVIRPTPIEMCGHFKYVEAKQ